MKPLHVEFATADAGARHVVPLSGGKDSTALAVYLAQTYPQLTFEYVFSDTGAELPETYEYFDRLEHVLGATVTRVSALDLLNVAAKPGRIAFDVVLYEHFAGFLPSPRTRWCTRMLKIHPFERAHREGPGVLVHRHPRRRSEAGIHRRRNQSRSWFRRIRTSHPSIRSRTTD